MRNSTKKEIPKVLAAANGNYSSLWRNILDLSNPDHENMKEIANLLHIYVFQKLVKIFSLPIYILM